jgi:hypothetical protein
LNDDRRAAWQVYRQARGPSRPKDEAEHFIKCPTCGGWIDCLP